VLADNIINLANKSKEELIQLGDNARKYYEENFDKQALLDRMDIYFAHRAALEDK
jgi:hypothetical protein